MSPKQIELVQQSWTSVWRIADTAAQLFYNRLFEIDPSLRKLFKRDLEQQGRQLMRMIDVAVSSLSRLEALVPKVEALGRRHAGYGVTDAHYGTVAEALLWTLERGLGEAFVPEVREAWTRAYTLLAQIMQTAARESAQAVKVAA
jgi:nitric oxide dioxygenase